MSSLRFAQDHRFAIIEGTDGVGKTIFAKYLANQWGVEYVHASAPTASTAYDEYVKPLIDRPPAILDRWHIGEMVWPAIFGRPSLFRDEIEFIDICANLRSLDACVIYVGRPERDIIATLKKRGETRDQIDSSIRAIPLIHDAVIVAARRMPVRAVHSDALPTAPAKRRKP